MTAKQLLSKFYYRNLPYLSVNHHLSSVNLLHMPIDIAYLLILAFAVFKGYSKGFVIAIFSFVAVVVGLAAAIKLSVVVAGWLGSNTGLSSKLLPIVAFAIVMISVALLVRWAAFLIEKALQAVMLGFVNKIAGILLYIIIYTIVFSVVLFFAEKISLIKPETIAASRFYNFVQPWGPKAIDMFGAVIPVFKNMFQQLENFFDGVATKATT